MNLTSQLELLLTKSHPIIIDGGLSNVLEAKGCDLNHKLWTAKLIEENPESIIQTHMDYINAGAQVIATASYQASFPGLNEEGYSSNDAEDIMIKSVELAQEAIGRCNTSREILIAASMGPYGAYLADGSEYRGNYGISKDELIDFHAERIAIFDNSNADLLAFETIPSFVETQVISNLLVESKKPAWVSFSCKDDGHINDGASISEASSIFKDHPTVFGIGINCTHPKFISSLITKIKESTPDKKVLIYPNSGEVYDATTKTWIALSEPLNFANMTKEWINQGADLIGGCCRIGPEHIEGIRNSI